MEKVKLWFMLHDGEYVVCAFQTMQEVSNFLTLKYYEGSTGDKGYVFMLGTPDAAKIANNPDLESDPTIADSFHTITLQGIAVLFDPKEELLSAKAIDWDYSKNELKELYGDLDMEQVLLSLLPSVSKIATLNDPKTEGGIILPPGGIA